MRMVQGLFSLLIALSTVSANTVKTDGRLPSKRASLPPIKIHGNAFWADDKRLYIRGIDYQPGGSSARRDPLADPDICLRDIKQFEDLGINAIRVYAVDNSKNHDKCMHALNNAGIYLILDVNTPDYSLNRLNPKPSYNTKYLQSVFATVEMFAKYDNTLAFFSGNEVINEEAGTDKSAPFIKAITRDIKRYLHSRGLRAVPVGYSAADIAENRNQMAMYLNCGSDDVRSDFFAFNNYSWCNTNFKESGWDQKVKNFTDYGLPIFLSEWGCITNRPRKFKEMSALMSPKMSGVYSGGLMYEYSVEENNYGIVRVKGDDIHRLDEFDLFKEALRKYPTPSGNGGAASTTHAVECPTSDSSWNVNPTVVPQMPQQAKKFMKHGAGSGPGIEGPGSQNAPDSMTAADKGVLEEMDEKDGAGAFGRPCGIAGVVTGLTICLALYGALLY